MEVPFKCIIHKPLRLKSFSIKATGEWEFYLRRLKYVLDDNFAMKKAWNNFLFCRTKRSCFSLWTGLWSSGEQGSRVFFAFTRPALLTNQQWVSNQSWVTHVLSKHLAHVPNIQRKTLLSGSRTLHRDHVYGWMYIGSVVTRLDVSRQSYGTNFLPFIFVSRPLISSDQMIIGCLLK